jgi:hypothetical protein
MTRLLHRRPDTALRGGDAYWNTTDPTGRRHGVSMARGDDRPGSSPYPGDCGE